LKIGIEEQDLARLLQENVALSEQVTELQRRGTELIDEVRDLRAGRLGSGGGILTGSEIAEQVRRGRIEIDPFDPKMINPASVDLTLGEEVQVFAEPFLDVRKSHKTQVKEWHEGKMFLRPGFGYLMHTRERIKTDHYVPVVDGKSSNGRLFIQIHQTAGYGDPGYDGQYTLEVTVTHPVVVYLGMRIAQMRFHTKVGSGPLYKGKYRGEKARGAVPSAAHKEEQ